MGGDAGESSCWTTTEVGNGKARWVKAYHWLESKSALQRAGGVKVRMGKSGPICFADWLEFKLGTVLFPISSQLLILRPSVLGQSM